MYVLPVFFDPQTFSTYFESLRTSAFFARCLERRTVPVSSYLTYLGISTNRFHRGGHKMGHDLLRTCMIIFVLPLVRALNEPLPFPPNS